MAEREQKRGILRVTIDWIYKHPLFSGIVEIEPEETEKEARARLLQEAIDTDFD